MPDESTAVPRADEARPDGHLNAAISNKIVQLLAEYTGRGPTKARSFLKGDMVVCLLQDTLTKGERAMAAAGERDAVIATRRTYQSLMREDATAAIEQLTGRKVIAFMSDNHVDPDLAVEAFVLEPETGNGQADAGPTI